MSQREQLKRANRWVIKIGSALLTENGRGLNHGALDGWAEQIAKLREQQREVVLVSSGAVAEGMSRLGWRVRPHELHKQQAAAAIGQMGLVQAYESCFKRHQLHSAQILLTHEDLSDRTRYLNARSTLKTLLELGTIPVVNENDTVATDEIRFGDNDSLAALVCNLMDADVLVILTDQKGLYDRNPREHADAQLIHEADATDTRLLGFAGDAASSLSRGGMRTKIYAAQRAARSGTHTVIASGSETQPILRVANGEPLGTLLLAHKRPLAARKQWIANQTKAKGCLWLDQGAQQALQSKGRSLLAVGVKKVIGDFKRGDIVSFCNHEGVELGRGVINYSSQETQKIAGKPSEAIESLLGYVDEPELIHRDNLSLLVE